MTNHPLSFLWLCHIKTKRQNMILKRHQSASVLEYHITFFFFFYPYSIVEFLATLCQMGQYNRHPDSTSVQNEI